MTALSRYGNARRVSRASRAERNAVARIGYRLDRFLGLSAGAQILAVLALGVLVGLAFGAAIWAYDGPAGEVAAQAAGGPSPEAHSLGAGFWWALTRMLDGGTVYNDSGTGLVRQALGVVVTLVGLLALAVVTGWMTSRITDRVAALRRGTSPVFERHHVLVLGWNAHAPVVLSELAASGLEETVVILADHEREVIEEGLKQQVLGRHGLRFVVRRGDPASASAVRRAAARRAKAILVLPDTPSGHCGDRAAICARCSRSRARSVIFSAAARPAVVVEVATAAGREMVDLCDALGKTIVVDAHEINARVIAQSVRHFGAFASLRRILSLGAHSIELWQNKVKEGDHFDDLFATHEDGILVGVLRDGAPIFAPAGDFALRTTDTLLVLDDASDARRTRLELRAAEAVEPDVEAKKLRVLVVRIRSALAHVLAFLEAESAVEVTIVAEAADLVEATALLGKAKLTRTSIAYVEGDPLDGALLARLAAERPDAVLVLAPDVRVEPDRSLEADADQVLTLLQLRRGGVGEVHAVVEVRNADARKLPKRLRHRDDFIVSREIVGMLLARELHAACLDRRSPADMFAVLERVGSRLEVAPVSHYASAHASLTFGELAVEARARGELAVGFVEENRAPHIAPQHDARVPFAATRLVVLTPEHEPLESTARSA